MNVLNQWTRQAQELFAEMPLQSKLMAGLLLAAIGVSTAFLVRGSKNASMEYLLSGTVFNDMELHRIENALSSKGLRDYDIVGKRIKIPSLQRDAYIKAIGEAKAIPQRLGNPQMDSLLSGNMFDSELQRRLKNQTGREQAISEALERLPYVDEAWVTYDEQREGFARDYRRTAAVYIRPASMALDISQARNIAKQVKNSFAGLEYQDISVLDLMSGEWFGGSEDPLNSEDGIYHHRKQAEEEKLRRKALSLLSHYGEVKVEVNVELDPMLREATEQTKFDEKPIAISSQTTKKDSDTSRPSVGGRPGAEPNAGANRGGSLASSSESSSKVKEATESEKRIAGQTKSLVERVGLGIQRATFAVSIPRSHFRKEFERKWIEEHPKDDVKDMPPPPKGELESIRNNAFKEVQSALANLIPQVRGGEDKFPLVMVNDYFDEEPIPPPVKTASQVALAWAKESWQTMAMFGLGLLALLILRSALNAQPKPNDEEFARGFGVSIDPTLDRREIGREPDDIQEADGEVAASRQGQGVSGAEAESGPIRLQTTGGQVREQLTEIVRNDPSAAVNILRSWIGDAA
jgi:flagellar M-ring protein FliF